MLSGNRAFRCYFHSGTQKGKEFDFTLSKILLQTVKEIHLRKLGDLVDKPTNECMSVCVGVRAQIPHSAIFQLHNSGLQITQSGPVGGQVTCFCLHLSQQYSSSFQTAST